MGRVETRMYRRRKRRSRMIRRWLFLLLAVMAAALIWLRSPAALDIERIGKAAEEQQDSIDKQVVETREVTLPEEIWYAIQTGVFSTEIAASQKADAYAERGAPGVVIQEGDKWRVFIACYPTETEASSVRDRLEQHQKVDTYLYQWVCPELRLRLTGKVGQLDAVEAGFTLLTSTAAALRDTATELDAAQLTTQEVAAKINALDGQITLWEQNLHSSFGKKLPALAEDLLGISGAWDTRCTALLQADSATTLSATLKAHAMGMYDEIASWRRDFAAR